MHRPKMSPSHRNQSCFLTNKRNNFVLIVALFLELFNDSFIHHGYVQPTQKLWAEKMFVPHVVGNFVYFIHWWHTHAITAMLAYTELQLSLTTASLYSISLGVINNCIL